MIKFTPERGKLPNSGRPGENDCFSCFRGAILIRSKKLQLKKIYVEKKIFSFHLQQASPSVCPEEDRRRDKKEGADAGRGNPTKNTRPQRGRGAIEVKVTCHSSQGFPECPSLDAPRFEGEPRGAQPVTCH